MLIDCVVKNNNHIFKNYNENVFYFFFCFDKLKWTRKIKETWLCVVIGYIIECKM